MNDLKENLRPLLDRTPFKILYAPCSAGDTAAARIQAEPIHIQWRKTHYHKHYCREILFVVSGSLITFSGNDFFHCPPGTLQFFPNNEAHNSYYYPGACGLNIWAKIQNTRLVCFVHQIHSSYPDVEYSIVYSYSFTDTEILEKVNKAWDELPLAKPETIVEIEALFRLVFTSLYRSIDNTADIRQELMITIRKMLSDNCGRDMDLDYLARLAGCTKQHFMRKFKEVNGCTTGEVIEKARLRELDEILPGTRTKELAYKLGFDSAAAFCHWKKKHSGKLFSNDAH